jgi:phage terminase small subunit
MPALTNAKHERFAQALAKGDTSDGAYVSAGFSANRGNAARLNANESVRKRVAELQEKAAEKVETTIADIVAQLDEDRTFAIKCEAPAAAIAATMGKAKVLGLIVDKSKIDVNTVAIIVTSEDAGL